MNFTLKSMVAPFFRSYGLSTAKQKVQALETGGAGLMFGAETDYPDLNLNGTHRLNNNITSVLWGLFILSPRATAVPGLGGRRKFDVDVPIKQIR